LRFGRLVGVFRRLLVDRARLGVRHRPGLVDRIADHIDDASERAVADRHRDRLAGIDHFLPAYEALARIHRDRAHGRFAQVLGHFEQQPGALVLGLERIEDRRQVALELHVDDGADDLSDVSDLVGWRGHRLSLLAVTRGYDPRY